MTQEELAERLGVTESRVSAIEQDEQAPAPDQIREIETALGPARGQILDGAGMIEGALSGVFAGPARSSQNRGAGNQNQPAAMWSQNGAPPPLRFLWDRFSPENQRRSPGI